MKKFLKKAKGVIAVGLAVALLSTSAAASEGSKDYDNSELCFDGGDQGMMSYDVDTGETTFIPPEEIEMYSDETEGFSLGYNPNADEYKDNEELIEPYYYDHGRSIVKDPQNKEMCCNTVKIVSTYTDDRTGIVMSSQGTGFMIGPNAVATAAHVIYHRGSDGNFFVGHATIIPANNTGSNPKPFGTASAKKFYCGGGWANNGDYSDDWGIIELKTNIGNKTGWLGLRWQSASYKNETTFVNGYPGEVNGHSNGEDNDSDRDLYFRHGKVNTSSKTNILESTDMFASHGDSGGPCYIYSIDTGYTAIGITSNCHPVDPKDKEGINIDSVRFRTIDKALFERMVKYRTSTL